MTNASSNLRNGEERGSALLLAIVATIVLAGMAGAVMAVSGAFKHESTSATENSRALYVAEAGLSEGIAAVQADDKIYLDNTFPDLMVPTAFGNGTYWGDVSKIDDETLTVTAFGSISGQTRGVEAVLVKSVSSIYDHALFAGNSSGDPLYDMGFGGNGTQGDAITGNIYSGGNITVSGSATVNGDAKAVGTVTGMPGISGSEPIPDIPAMNYETNNDFDVAKLFAGGGASYSSNALGGSAWQMPESSPAHIFRLNPSDRTANTSTTVKNDFFLEDPYESVNTSSTVTAANGTHLTLSGMDGNPGPDGNKKVYFIDGNLWVHNPKIYSFTMWNSKPEAVQVTFVVKGNVYFSDNILYHDPKNDGVAFIAMKDIKVADSGNIYFGDPTFGTLEQMDSFMYAENNFLDNNLSATGSAKVTVNGNMTAGNQVLIKRDFGSQHSKLTVNFDDRILNGTISLPGLPGVGPGGVSWGVSSWREIAAP